MPNGNPSQRNADLSKVSEILRVMSLSHSNKAEISVKAFDELLITLRRPTALAGGGGMIWGYWRTKVSENA